MKNAIRIRDQLANEIKSIKFTSTSTSHNNNNGLKIKSLRHASEDVRICYAIATSLYMKAARLCGGNDTVYRSLPFTVTGYNSSSSSSSNNTAAATDWSQVSTFMTAEVMLLHPQTGSAMSLSTSRPPEYIGNITIKIRHSHNTFLISSHCYFCLFVCLSLVFQDLVFGGRASMRHVCAVDFNILQALRNSYKPTTPLALSGREVKLLSSSQSSNDELSNLKRKVWESMETRTHTRSTNGGTKRSKDNSTMSQSSTTTMSVHQHNTNVTQQQQDTSITKQMNTQSQPSTKITTTTTTTPTAADEARQRFLARKGRL